ncbi:MAG: hypothetical protein LBH69_02815 [Methanomassiliicoccaceae archaeon]|jgi:hypothetical protein|nr:hypothetical protein [Methanomassiliicoccaceae archaeon]
MDENELKGITPETMRTLTDLGIKLSKIRKRYRSIYLIAMIALIMMTAIIVSVLFFSDSGTGIGSPSTFITIAAVAAIILCMNTSDKAIRFLSRPLRELEDEFEAMVNRARSEIVTAPKKGLNEIYEELQRYDKLRGKMTADDEWITIRFHKYLDLQINSDICRLIGITQYYYGTEELTAFIDELLYEGVVFFQDSRTGRSKILPGSDLQKLMMKKNKKGCRVFSAMTIYVDK